MNSFGIGTRHVVWVDPFCDDVAVEVVSYDRFGDPLVRTLDGDRLLLEPHEYVFPKEEQLAAIQRAEQVFKEVYGEDL